jgi:hypothetical protein
MNIPSLVQYATFFSGGGLLGIGIALFINRQQVNTQILLAVASRYDDLLESSSAGFRVTLQPENKLPEPSDELSISMLRYCTHIAFIFFLYQAGRIPRKIWKLVLPTIAQPCLYSRVEDAAEGI